MWVNRANCFQRTFPAAAVSVAALDQGWVFVSTGSQRDWLGWMCD